MRILKEDCAFDLVLCDVMMSDITGVDWHFWLTERLPRLGEQLIFMTGGAFTARARQYLTWQRQHRSGLIHCVDESTKVNGDQRSWAGAVGDQ